jgi:hypothetical protein
MAMLQHQECGPLQQLRGVGEVTFRRYTVIFGEMRAAKQRSATSCDRCLRKYPRL